MRYARFVSFLGYAFGGLSAVAAAVYVIVYLYRWEWQRALLSGVLLLVVEVFLATAVVLGRVARLQRRLAETDARAEEVLRRLEDSRARSPDSFRWLDGPRGTFVFVPVLVAAGAALSVVAVVIQRLAGVTSRASAERRLAGRLADLTAPPGGIQGYGARVEEPPPVPPPRPQRTLALGIAALAAAALLAAAVDLISDATQTRPETLPDSEATTVVFRIEVRGAEDDPDAAALAARELWESCRRSTSKQRENAVLSRLEPGVYAGVLRPALPEHDLFRLHGCLSDARANRALARVLGEGQAPPSR